MNTEVQFAQLNFPGDWSVPADCTGQLLVGGLDGGVAESYYLLDFDNRLIRHCAIDVSRYARAMTAFLQDNVSAEHLPYGIRSHDAVVYNFTQPHEGLMLRDGRIIVGMHNASYMREISFDQKHVSTYQSPEEFRPLMLSAQNSLDATGDTLFYSETNFADRLQRYTDRRCELRTTVKCVDVYTGATREIGSVATTEAVHEVKLAPDQQSILLTEFCLMALANPPAHEDGIFNQVPKWDQYYAQGLEQSKLYCMDRDTGAHEAIEPTGYTPGHIEFSAVDPQRFYLSCHNLSKAHGKVILHGAGKLVVGRVSDSRVAQTEVFTNDSFFRVTSHKVFEYEGVSRIAVTVFPNRLYILSDPDLRIIADVELFPHEAVTANGLYFCTLLPHVPIWLDTSDNGRYVILISNEYIHLFDQKTSTLQSLRGYSFSGRFAGTAHVTNMKDFSKRGDRERVGQ
jgi:hypothetical protein